MFVLMEVTDYEGSDLLGVYSSMEEAVVQAQRWLEAERFFDGLEIYALDVVAPALRAAISREPDWSDRVRA
jgi:hypothetical protein